MLLMGCTEDNCLSDTGGGGADAEKSLTAAVTAATRMFLDAVRSRHQG